MESKRGRPVGTYKDTAVLKPFEEQIKTEIRVLIATKDVNLKKVAYAMTKAGIEESAKGLSAKLKAGTFSAAYYLALKETISKM